MTLRELFLLQHHNVKESNLSLGMGVGFMIMGIFLSIISLIRYRTTLQQIETEKFEPSPGVAVFLSLLIAFFGAILAVYLLLS